MKQGSTGSLDPGPCWIEERDGVVRILRPGHPPPQPVEMSIAQLAVHLARRHIVYVSW